MKDVSFYLLEALTNIKKRIERSKNKDHNYNFDKSILKEIVVSCTSDINDDEFLEFITEYNLNINTKIMCTEIENDMDYTVESEYHDYCHTSSWVDNIKNNYIYSYFEIIEEDEITYDILLHEAKKISQWRNDDYFKQVISDYIFLITKNKMRNNIIKGITNDNNKRSPNTSNKTACRQDLEQHERVRTLQRAVSDCH